MTDREQWLAERVEYRTIERFPGYRFGSDGSVWSCRRQAGADIVGEPAWHRLRPSKWNKHGHLQVAIRQAGKRVDVGVHRLILEAFVGPCPEGCEGRHFPDRDPTNNSIGNLQWSTRSENLRDRWQHGTMRCGERHHNAKLTVDVIGQIRAARLAGKTQRQIARQFSIRQSTVWGILAGKAWSHV